MHDNAHIPITIVSVESTGTKRTDSKGSFYVAMSTFKIDLIKNDSPSTNFGFYKDDALAISRGTNGHN